MLNKQGYHKSQYVQHLLDGTKTKEQIAKQLAKSFNMKITTARNQVNWTCSQIKKYTGQQANYKRPQI